ncbi:MAG: site-2 protease family protein [Chloroflexi bacterium]|nr:MAG: site-2 protease family protein [Chloroflexota bacterium]MBL1196739.1 site-2 protease family protein [Chloroflexota bacterium]NOH14033.1 site-2 protease family protein [Chloroflexota bacterium]
MNQNVTLFRIWGIPIGFNVSWLFILVFLVWSLSVNYFPNEYPELSAGLGAVLGLVTGLLLFASVLFHELAHAWVALQHKIPVRAISLFFFGGVAQIEEEPPSPKAEFQIAAAGPLASLFLAIFFGGLFLLDQSILWLAAPSIWLARINLVLAVFNLIPAFPLDGGRILRAGLWAWNKNKLRATEIASTSGQLIGYAIAGYGVFVMWTGSFFNGLWLILISSFLINAAGSSRRHASIQETLQDVKVSSVMSSDLPQVPHVTAIQQLVDDYVLALGQRFFFVTQNAHLNGMLTLSDISRLPQRQWPFTTANKLMVPTEQLHTVVEDNSLWDALFIMDRENVNQLPVVATEGDIIGVISREQLLHQINLRANIEKSSAPQQKAAETTAIIVKE